MNKNEATNTFTEGLVMDLNPLTTPNNVLTNCLNGTLITYNGNEYVLQNDMGNGRVETAYLPSGYVPIGIKESGGIIYVASYNPITNKGQVGSFPSPERNISSEELNDSDAVIDLSKFSENLVQRVKLLGDNYIIRAGDKFSIIMDSKMEYSLSKLLSNYQNTENGEIKTLKNKLITLSVAVLDSNNNLYDITNTLKRFDQNTNKELDGQYLLPANILFNSEYFTQLEEESGSQDIDSFREKKAHNVFKSKLIGNLCIIATLNTVDFFDLSINGEKLGEDFILYLDSTFQYNCPDGKYNNTQIYGSESDFDPNNSIVGYNLQLYTYDNGVQNIKYEGVINFNTDTKFDETQLSDTVKSCVSYDSINKLYKSKQQDSINISDLGVSSGVIYYTATPISIVGPLEGLTREGQLNLDKIGTGELYLTTWKYFKNQDYTLLTWGLESYPRYNEILSDFRLEFYDITNPTEIAYTYRIENKRSYNGIFNEVLHLPQQEDNKNRLFLVKIIYKSSREEQESVLDYRWFFNTRLYNDAYSKYTIEQWGHDFGSIETDKHLKEDFRKIEYNFKFSSDFDRGTATQNSPVRIVDTSEEVVYSAKTGINYDIRPILDLSLKGYDNIPFSQSITYQSQYSINKQKCLDSASAPNISILGTLSSQLINNQENSLNFKNFIEVDDSEWENGNRVKISGEARLQYKPASKPVRVSNIFTPIMDKPEEYFGTLNSGHPSNVAIFMAGTGRGSGMLNFCPNVSTQTNSQDDLFYNFHKNRIDLVFKGGSHIYGINKELPMNYQEIQDILKSNNPNIIIPVGSYGFKEKANGFGESGKYKIETRVSWGAFPSREPEYFQGAFWKDINGTPVLLGCYSTSNSIATALSDVLKNYYKRNSTKSGEVATTMGLTDTYGYNTEYTINMKLVMDCMLTNINIGYSEYIQQVQNTIDTVYQNSTLSTYSTSTEESLLEQASFTFQDTITSTYEMDIQLDVQGLDLLYSQLSAAEVDVAFGRYDSNTFVPVYFPNESITYGRTYYFKEGTSVKAELADETFDQTFQEKDGKYYIRGTGTYVTHNNKYVEEQSESLGYGYGLTMSFDNIPAVNTSLLGELKNLEQW